MMILNPAFKMHRQPDPVVGASGYFSGAPRPWWLQSLELETVTTTHFPALPKHLEGLAHPLRNLQPELCVCYSASWEMGSGIAEGLLWINISLNLVLAATSTQSRGPSSPKAPPFSSKGAWDDTDFTISPTQSEGPH